jgi:hypothetical protein
MRYTPLIFSTLLGFPNDMLDTKIWGSYLPQFREDHDYIPGKHLQEFHECMNMLGIVHEDVLMNLFMMSLARDA